MIDALGEQSVRASIFFAVLFVMAALEWRWPRRATGPARWSRWLVNVSLAITNILALRLIAPVSALAVAVWAQAQGFGLLNVLAIPHAGQIVLTIIVMDALIYAAHVAFHEVPILWRIHRVHHVDTELDVSTGFRFHPVEIVLSMLFKASVIAVLGLPPVGVVVYEILLSSLALFNHANWKLSVRWDRYVRWVIVTPDMHRIHHSVLRREAVSNYGNIFPIWDRCFGTYVARPRDGQDSMRLGLTGWRDGRSTQFRWLLRLPFGRGDRR